MATRNDANFCRADRFMRGCFRVPSDLFYATSKKPSSLTERVLTDVCLPLNWLQLFGYPSPGLCCACRVAKSSFSQQECALNVAAAIQGATQHVPRKWAGVQALYLKTSDSVALPVYQTLPSDSNRIKA